MRIEDSSLSDMEEAVALWERCGLVRPWNDPRADFRTALDAPSSTVLAGRDDNSVLIGTCMVGYDGHRGWVYYLAVDPARRGTGTGRALMQAAEKWLRVRGAPKLQLMVRVGNDAVLAFYRSLGFEPQSVVTLGKRLDRE